MISPKNEKEIRRILKSGRKDTYEKFTMIAEILGISYDTHNNAVDLSRMGRNPIRASEEELAAALPPRGAPTAWNTGERG